MGSGEFKPLDEKFMMEYIQATPSLYALLGNNLQDLQIKEVGDGNLNFVFIVQTSSGSLVIKQALPYIRCIGESWPMTKERAYFEASALKEQGRLCPDHVPEVYHFDRTMSLIGMRYLKPPHIILRKGLIAGIEYLFLAEHISEFMAKTLFTTSLLSLTTTEHKSAVAKYCGNVEMCRLTEQVVFSDPYKVSEYNHWTSPYLDKDAEAVREDNILRLEVAELKLKFCERAQALIHGDLHTGSVMVTHDSTQVIDPEFAFYGPMGFDIGAFLANLILAYFSQDGHAEQGNDRKMCRLTEQVVFSDPYKVSEYNHWTSPYLDKDAEAVREDNILKLEVAELKLKFCERAQALIHGDLHTGSVMVTHDSTQVIDPEFAFYGPMGFDIGAFLANLILAYFSQDGHAEQGNDRKNYKEWILKTTEDTWSLFDKKFTALWDEHKNSSGDAYLPEIDNNAELQLIVKQKFMKELLHDSLGFGAAKMIRRIVGVAHVEDFEAINDAARRADCERLALNFAKMLLKERTKFQTITEVVLAIQNSYS